MRYRLLGALEIWDSRHWSPLRQAKWRALLAILLCHANQVVSAGQLIEEMWGRQTPKSAGKSLHACVSDVRRTLGDADGTTLMTHSPGYELRVRRGELDCQRFDELVTLGRRALDEGALDLAATRLGEATALWRGPALLDVPTGPTVEAEAVRLEASRLGAWEALIETELKRGRHAELLPQLHALVRQHPFREALHGHLMLALYRTGQQAEALAVLRRLRHELIKGLGLEPGPALLKLQHQILRADPALLADVRMRGGARVVPVLGSIEPPRQLPPASANFTGRREESARLRVLSERGERKHGAIMAAYGMAGTGKSALMIHVAHQLAGGFPDGQLYTDLRGATTDAEPLKPLAVLRGFLRALGVNGCQIPMNVDEASARLRSRTVGRRVLFVLDNAHDISQVMPLLPSGAGCGVLITSRPMLAGLSNANVLHLDVLSPRDALALLGRLIGEDRIAAEPATADELVRSCGWLPLALVIAGARLTARPAWPLRVFADRLADAGRRLDELDLSNVSVRASFRLSFMALYDSTEPNERAAAEAFLRLGSLNGSEAGVPLVAQLLGRSEAASEQLLERLVDAELLNTTSPGRYRMHDLMSAYAYEQASRQRSRDG